MVYADYCPKCKVGVVIEVNAETDFVAKNDKFVDFVKEATKVVMLQNPADVEALMACKTEAGETVDEALKNLILVIMRTSRFVVSSVTRAFALLTSTAAAPRHPGQLRDHQRHRQQDEFTAYGKDIAMQVAAANPSYVDGLLSPLRSLPRRRRSCWLRWLAIPRTPTSLML